MVGVMEFTADLVECVNNDTKEMIAENLGGSSSPMETSVTILEKEEDEEKEEEIMKLFWTPCIMPTSGEFPKSLNHSNKTKKSPIKEKSANEGVGLSKKQQKRMMVNHDKGYHIHKGLKMFKSTLDSEDIFEDWNWNFWECEKSEDIFADWLWNLEITQEKIRQKFYDDPTTENSWNDFHFWNFSRQTLTETMALTVLVTEDVDATVTPDSGCFSTLVEEEKGKNTLHKWLNCKYWEETFQNETILQSLLDDEVMDADRTPTIAVNFWDESASNQATIQLLMEQEEEESKFQWEDKDIIFALLPKEPKPVQPVQYFPWEDPDTIAGLMEDQRPSRRTSGDSGFLWDDPAAIGLLLTDEEDEAYLPWDDKTDMTEELLPLEEEDSGVHPSPSPAKATPQHNSWEEWSLWDQFGTSRQIIQAFEEVGTVYQPESLVTLAKKVPQLNIDEAFWNITLAVTDSKSLTDQSGWCYDDCSDGRDHYTPKQTNRKSGNQPPDPLNTFRAFKHIFNETDGTKSAQSSHGSKVKKPPHDDMLDIYSDWAPNMMADERIEKKRQRRGRGHARSNRVPVALGAEQSHRQPEDVRRPGTPTVTKKPKTWHFESSWIERKPPKKDRKTVQRADRTKKKLHAKIYAKQPRSMNGAYPA